MKNKAIILTLLLLATAFVAGCTNVGEIITSTEPIETPENSRVPYISSEPGEKERAFVMMDSGSDSNYEAYKGINRAAGELDYDLIVEYYYDLNDGSILDDIQKHVSAGRNYILFPGKEFRDSVLQTSSIYPDAGFVLFDDNITPGDNITSFIFSEYDLGFLAGYTATNELKNAKFGFIGGSETEKFKMYLNGFMDGLDKANENSGSDAVLSQENIMYSNSFFDMENAAMMASQMYDRGVNAIFIVTGEAGKGAVAEASLRAFRGEDVWIIGADEDWYEEGIYNGSDSVVLTSAVKKFDVAAYIVSFMFANGELNEYEVIEGTIINGAVGLPDENPNLSPDTYKLINDQFFGN